MTGRSFDDVIVGQGLAGTTLAWQLRHGGRSVLVIDRDARLSASSVAAGLMTPVTGQRLARSWRWDELWPAACTFYERVEQETGAGFFTRRAMVRLFAGPEERDLYESRSVDLGELVRRPDPVVDAASFHARHGGFEMPQAGQINVPKYLQVSRARFINDGAYLTARIDPGDVVLTESGVALPRSGVIAQRLTWCQGTDGMTNPGFPSVEFNPAKGEVLRLRIPGLMERRVTHGEVWLLPLGGGQFLAGATYDWDTIDGVPTAAGRDEISQRLRRLLKTPFQIIGHTAGVRPTLRDFRPVAGLHPRHRQLAIFNGLGSKGALSAPGIAAELARCFTDENSVDADVRYQRWAGHSTAPVRPPRLTELAHQLVRSRLRPGESAVDATAGNGRDTELLARTVGPEGQVIAFDVQEIALQRTAERLCESGLKNVTLVPGDHAGLADHLPADIRGQVGAVMFNLGYLPGGDRSVITRPPSTIRALQAALSELRSGGIVTIVAYPGHGGGAAETAAVTDLISGLEKRDWDIGESSQVDGGSSVPRLLWAVRR